MLRSSTSLAHNFSPLNTVLASKGTVRYMRPIQLKLALFCCFVGILIDVLFVPFNKELYGSNWVVVFGLKSVISIILLIVLVLIFRGFGSLRYLYTAFVIFGVARIFYFGAFFGMHSLMSLLLGILAGVLWFLPTSNKWFKED
jgi:hypothetical protein